jgi:hypothetical protein
MKASLAPVSTTPLENVIGADHNSTSREGRVHEAPALSWSHPMGIAYREAECHVSGLRVTPSP